MKLELDRVHLRLGADRTMRLGDAQGARIVCVRGMLWVTEAGGPRDIVLAAGEVHVVECRGTAVISAVTPSSLWIAEAGRMPLRQRLRAQWTAFLERYARARATRLQHALVRAA